MSINLGNITLPVGAAISRYALLGKSGAGKTNTGTVMAEEFISAGVPTIIIDPLGKMWGLRSSADGTEAGLPVSVLGGAHGDAPLRADRGAVVAEALAEGVSAVLDMSLMERDEQQQFVSDFLPVLARRASRVLHLIVEEAETFAPERTTSKAHARCRAACTVFARTARNSGIGWTFSTQRAQILAKEVIDSAEVLIAMRMTGELAQDAIGAEVKSRVGKVCAGDIMAALPVLARGEAFLIPDSDWLDGVALNSSAKIRFRPRSTFDSATPPKVGETRTAPTVLAAVDLHRLSEAMQPDTEVMAAGTPGGKAEADISRGTRPSESEIEARIAAAVQAKHDEIVQLSTAQFQHDLHTQAQAHRNALVAIRAEVDQAIAKIIHVSSDSDTSEPLTKADTPRTARPPAPATATSKSPLKAGSLEQRILDALDWWSSVSVTAPTREQVAFLARAKPTGGHFANTLSSMKTAGLIEYLRPGCISPTSTGVARANRSAAPLTRQALLDAARSVITEGGQRRIFDTLAQSRANFGRGALAKLAGFTEGGGHYANTLSAMKTAGLITYPEKGSVALSDTFKWGGK